MGLVGGTIALLIAFMSITPTGMIPNEDTGTIMGSVTLPPGTSQERAREVLAQVDSLIAAEPAVQSRTVISGFSFIGSGQGTILRFYHHQAERLGRTNHAAEFGYCGRYVVHAFTETL